MKIVLKVKMISINLLVIFYSLSTYSQLKEDVKIYNALLSEAKWESYINKMIQSNRLLEKANKISELDAEHYLIIAKNYLKLNRESKSISYITKAITKGITIDEIIEDQDTLLGNFVLRNKNYFNNIFKLNRTVYFKSINIDLLIELNKIVSIDQYSRSNIFNTLESDTTAETYRDKAIDFADSINYLKVKYLFKKYNKEIFKEIGSFHSIKFKIILWHIIPHLSRKNDTIGINNILNIIKAGVNAFYIPSHYYTSTFDRYYPKISSDKEYTSFFGTGAEYNNENKRVFIKIFDIQNIDKRLKEFGLLTLKQIAAMRNINLPIEYIKQNQ
jgi:hypothetical protein